MINYLTDYAYFTNKYDLDKAASLLRQANWNDMNHTDLDVLDVIRRYSVKFGAAHLKHDTIAKAIRKSNPTVRRAIRKLNQLGIIDRIHYVRPVMNGLGANIYAIRPYNNSSKLEQLASDKSQQVKQRVEQAPKQEAKKTYPPEQLAVPTTLFGRMKKMLSSTIGEETLACRFFGVYRQLTIPMLKFSIHEHKSGLFEQLGIQALRITVQSRKQKNIQILPSYYYGILCELIEKSLFDDAFKDYDVPVEGFYCPGDRKNVRAHFLTFDFPIPTINN